MTLSKADFERMSDAAVEEYLLLEEFVDNYYQGFLPKDDATEAAVNACYRRMAELERTRGRPPKQYARESPEFQAALAYVRDEVDRKTAIERIATNMPSDDHRNAEKVLDKLRPEAKDWVWAMEEFAKNPN